MSQIDSTLNSASTLVTMDFIRNKYPDWGPDKLLKTGRIVTLIFMVLAALWAPQIARFDSLFQYLQAILSYAVPPVLAMYLLGLFGNEPMPRGTVGINRWVDWWCRFVFGKCGLAKTNIHFLYIGPALLALSLVLHIVGSLLSAPPDQAQIKELMWEPHNPWKEATQRPWYADFRYQSVGLLILTAVLVWTFR
jgi:solute:Na+ symporter, SSS family